MKSRVLRTALLLQAIAVAGVIGLALPGAAAAAQVGQSEKTDSGAAAPKPNSVGGVVVHAPRRQSKLHRIPPEKAAAFDEEAAKSEAWKKYRKSTPPATADTLRQADGYPGAQNLIPH